MALRLFCSLFRIRNNTSGMEMVSRPLMETVEPPADRVLSLEQQYWFSITRRFPASHVSIKYCGFGWYPPPCSRVWEERAPNLHTSNGTGQSYRHRARVWRPIHAAMLYAMRWVDRRWMAIVSKALRRAYRSVRNVLLHIVLIRSVV